MTTNEIVGRASRYIVEGAKVAIRDEIEVVNFTIVQHDNIHLDIVPANGDHDAIGVALNSAASGERVTVRVFDHLKGGKGIAKLEAFRPAHKDDSESGFVFLDEMKPMTAEDYKNLRGLVDDFTYPTRPFTKTPPYGYRFWGRMESHGDDDAED